MNKSKFATSVGILYKLSWVELSRWCLSVEHLSELLFDQGEGHACLRLLGKRQVDESLTSSEYDHTIEEVSEICCAESQFSSRLW